MCKKATIADQILALLSEGDKWADEIVDGVPAQPVSIRMCLCQLVKKGCDCARQTGYLSQKRGTRGAGSGGKCAKKFGQCENN